MHGTRCTCTTNPLILIVIPHDTLTVRAHIAQEDPDVRTGSLLYRGSALSSRQPRFRPSNLYNLTTHAQGGTGGWPTKTRGTWPNRSIYAYGVIARRARNEGRRTAVVLRRPVFERRAGVKCAIWRGELVPYARGRLPYARGRSPYARGRLLRSGLCFSAHCFSAQPLTSGSLSGSVVGSVAGSAGGSVAAGVAAAPSAALGPPPRRWISSRSATSGPTRC